MKFRGPGSSLKPAVEAARAASRASSQTMRPSNASRSSQGVQVGDWWLTTDESGALVADHLPSGRRQTLLLPGNPDDEQEGTIQ